MRVLPHIDSPGAYRRIQADDSTWLAALGVFAQRHGFHADQLHASAEGTNVVFASDESRAQALSATLGTPGSRRARGPRTPRGLSPRPNTARASLWIA